MKALLTEERLREIRESLNSVQRVHDPWPGVVQELFDEVCELRVALNTANVLIGEAADEAKELTDERDFFDAERCKVALREEQILNERDAALARTELLRKALVAARDVAADRELFVTQGPRGFAKAVAIIDAALKEERTE